jgi:glycerol-3-phosphate dehydrogenase
LDRDRLPLEKAVVMAGGKDEKRIIFGIPRHEMIIIGTTDTDYPGDPKDVHTESQDVHYLLGIVNTYFPGAKITKDDILASYAGVRPLVDDGSQTESKTSREHIIKSDPRNITFVAGGKYTTYRRMAADAVNTALANYYSIADRARFEQNNTKKPLNPKTSNVAMNEAISHLDQVARQYHFDISDAQLLLERHGMEALDIFKYYYHKNIKSIWELEAHFAIDHTMCMNLIDFYLRRVPLFLARKDHGLSLVETLADIFQEKLSWSSTERQKQVQEILNHCDFELSWKGELK